MSERTHREGEQQAKAADQPTRGTEEAFESAQPHGFKSVGNVQALQGLVGNRTVGRLLTGPADDAVAEAGRSFGRLAERDLGIARGTLNTGPSGGQRPPASQEATELRAASGQLRQDLQAARHTPVERARVERPATAAEPVPAESEPGFIAAEAAAHRVPTEGLRIPLDEATGSGPESQAALGQLRDEGAANPALLGLGEAINERIAGLRHRAAANASRVAAELDGAAAGQRAAALSALQSSKEGVDGVFGSTRARVGQSAKSSRAALAQRGQAGHQQAAQVIETEAGRVTQAVGQGTAAARSAFAEGDTELRTKGAAEAKRSRDHAGDLAQRALQLGRTEAARYRGSEEDQALGERKAAAVMDVARRFAAQLRDEGAELAGNLSGQVDEAREQVRTEAEPAVAGLADAGKGANDGIRTLAGSVHEGVDLVTRQGDEQFDAAEAGFGGELDNLHRAARGRGTALRANGEAGLDAALAAGRIAQARLAGQAGQLLDEAGRDAINELASAAREGAGRPPVIQRQAAGTDANVDAGPRSEQGPVTEVALAPLEQLGPALDQAAGNQSGELVRSLQGAAAGAGRAGTAWVGETQANLDRLGATAETGFGQVAGAAGGQVDQTVAAGRTKAAAEVDRVTGQVNGNVGEIRQSVRTGVGDATDRLAAGAAEGAQHANQTMGQVPAAMRAAAHAQGSWLGRLGNWFSNQLGDTWKSVKGMWDWKFGLSLLAGIGVGILAGIGVALLIAAAPFTLPGLAVVLIAGAVAGAAGFAAAQIAGNLLDSDPNRTWYDGVGHAAILGGFVGAGGLAASFFGLSLAAGTLAVMGAAGVGTVVANLATGRAWDDHLLANITIVGIFHALIKTVRDRFARRGTGPTTESEDYGPVEQHPLGTPTIRIDSPGRIRATDFRDSPDSPGELTCDLIDSESGAIFGSADVRLKPNGRPASGPELTLNPRFSKLPNGNPVVLEAPKGFAWTEASLKAAIDAYIRRFKRGPLNMSGQLAWSNLGNFQKEFARIRAGSPGLSEGAVAERAVRAISFGKHRIAMGYGDISVRYGNLGDVVIKGRTLQNVPRYVEVDARPSSPGAMPVVSDTGADDRPPE